MILTIFWKFFFLSINSAPHVYFSYLTWMPISPSFSQLKDPLIQSCIILLSSLSELLLYPLALFCHNCCLIPISLLWQLLTYPLVPFYPNCGFIAWFSFANCCLIPLSSFVPTAA